MWKRLRLYAHRAGLTNGEISVILFLTTTTIFGGVMRLVPPGAEPAHRDFRDAYRLHDSVFAARASAPFAPDTADSGDAAGRPASPPRAASNGKLSPGTVVNVNTATEARLGTIPGIGPSIAREIVAWRNAHGRFTSIDQLLDVKYIGPKKFEKMKPYITTAN